jgi:O-Antigen ligase
MPEHLRALVVILGLATIVFACAKAPACAVAMAPKDFKRRRNVWFAITLTLFLAHNFWIFIIGTAALLLFTLPREPSKLALFFFLLFAAPAISEPIWGLGIIEQFFTINYLRLLALAVLLPAFLSLRVQPDVDRFGRSIPDKLLAGYLILNLALMLTATTFTNALRAGVFYAFVDVFLPYYVASRSLRNLQAFRDALMGFVVAALVLSAIGAFEFARHWLLYAPLDQALGVPWGYGQYLERGDGVLRAQASTGQPIPLGFVIAVALGFYLYLKKSVPSSMAWSLGLLLLIAGLIAPMSRGPWIGAAAIVLVFTMTSPSPGHGLAKLGLLGVSTLPMLLVTPLGKEIIDHLPFVGTIDAGSVSYRERLAEVSIQVILQKPYFGSFHSPSSPAMEVLRQGQGIIDLVNTFLAVGLQSGLVGLFLFSGFFIAVAAGIYKGMKSLHDRNSELHLLGQGLFATAIGILTIISTVSSITVIPVIYWSLAGMGVGYARTLARAKATTTPDSDERFRPQPAPVQSRNYRGNQHFW